MADPKSIAARFLKESRNPPLHEAAKADEALGKAYRSLIALKMGWDSWEEIPPSARKLYDETVSTMHAIGKLRDRTYQLRMDIKKYARQRRGSNKAAAWDPKTWDDWELYDQPEAPKAARALTKALGAARRDFKQWAQKNRYLDPEWDDKDMAAVEKALRKAWSRHLVPQMERYSDAGAWDTEPRNVGLYALGNTAAKIYGGRSDDYLGFY